MKILILSDAWLPQLNGVVRTYQYLIRELVSQGHEVHIFGPLDCPRRSPLFHGVQLGFGSRQKIENLIDTIKPDRIHIPVEGPIGWTARWACIKRKIPFTTCFHSNFADFVVRHLPRWLKSVSPFIERLIFAALRRFHAPSKTVYVASVGLAELLTSKGFQGPFKLMTRGADPAIFYPGPKTRFHDFIPPIALSVGRISKEKNLDEFLKAPWHGSKIVIGDGPDLGRLKQNYPDAHFLGKIEGPDLGECFRSSDVFVFPSLFDTLGIVQIEALCSGLPIAALPSMAARSVITEPLFGCISDNLENAMTKALTAPGTPDERAAKAHNQYSWGKTAQQFLDDSQDYV